MIQQQCQQKRGQQQQQNRQQHEPWAHVHRIRQSVNQTNHQCRICKKHRVPNDFDTSHRRSVTTGRGRS